MERLGSAATRGLVRTMSSASGPISQKIQGKLSAGFQPVHLEIINESYMHSVPKDAETHFKVVVVSDKFENVKLISRHRLVNDVLKEELAGGVHALSIKAYTPLQWGQGKEIERSPNCMGGFGK